MSENVGTSSHRFYRPFLWIIIGIGGLAFFYSACELNLHQLDSRFAILSLMALLLGSWVIVPIPRFSSQISVSDTFIFLILLLYGGQAAVIVAAVEAVLSSLKFSRKLRTIGFNWGCSALSIFLTSTLLELCFGNIIYLTHEPISARFIAAICTMALAHYAWNSGFVAIGASLKSDQPIWATWRKHYLWTSITYFAGASAASVIAEMVHNISFYAFLMTLPIIAIVYLTYRTYLRSVETSATQAEQAEKHVEELSHYIAEQERIREQFSQVEKLSALGELASGVAHDFNNTLAGILGRAQLLLRTNDPEKLRRGLEIIIKTAQDGAKTVKRIQDFARQRRDHDFRTISVDQILHDVSEITRPRWKNRAEAANIQINLDLQASSAAAVMGDDSELREVLVNMVFNAVDAMPAGGNLTLSARNIGESVVISVRDTGLGMPSEVRSRIFDPFFTTKGEAGMGLGLAVSFGIVSRHGGTIEVDSEPGVGTEFRITLPVASDAANAANTTLSEASDRNNQSVYGSFARHQTGPRILVVDDEDFVRELLQEILEAEGCRVYLATNGSQALELFQQQQFDGVFTDVGMPGMSGWEVAQHIRQQNEVIPIAVITGWGEIVGSDEQKAASVDWVVAKPFTADRVSELVGEITRRRDGVDIATTLSAVAA